MCEPFDPGTSASRHLAFCLRRKERGGATWHPSLRRAYPRQVGSGPTRRRATEDVGRWVGIDRNIIMTQVGPRQSRAACVDLALISSAPCPIILLSPHTLLRSSHLLCRRRRRRSIRAAPTSNQSNIAGEGRRSSSRRRNSGEDPPPPAIARG